MRVIVISSAPFIDRGKGFEAYGPYIREMEIWAANCDEIAFACPVLKADDGSLLTKVAFPVKRMFPLTGFNVKSLAGIIRASVSAPVNFFVLFRAMAWADHIHLRCPGNLSLLGCIVQIFFPNKQKTAKYAGNWDPESQQPLSYKIQKRILNSEFLTKNIRVLVYGQWEGTSKNIVPFFTATYRESDKKPIEPRVLNGPIRFLFVGTISPGKRPGYALRLIAGLRAAGIAASVDFYGNGPERDSIQREVATLGLEPYAKLHGNRPSDEIREAYQRSHFLILASKSEGWPKAVAEAMFWGCVPLASAVSCVPFMLGFGDRGIILGLDLADDVSKIAALVKDSRSYEAKVAQCVSWSRQFTLDLFENQIGQMLRS